MNGLRGLSAFPITPADTGGHVEVAGLRRLVARLCAAGVDSVGLLGSTGTYAYLTRAERRRAIEAAMEETAGRVPLLVGVGALRTDEVVKLAQDARAIGASAALLAPISYTPLNDAEVHEHYVTVARQGGLPLCIYDNPGTTHFSFSPELIARLSRESGIVAVKRPGSDAVGDDLAALRSAATAGFSIGFSGDWHAAGALMAGGDAWYSVLAGLYPGICLRMVRAAQAGNIAEVRRVDAALAPIWRMFKAYSSLRVVYALAGIAGIVEAQPPRPILPLAPDTHAELAALVEQLPDEVML